MENAFSFGIIKVKQENFFPDNVLTEEICYKANILLVPNPNSISTFVFCFTKVVLRLQTENSDHSQKTNKFVRLYV